MTSRRSLVAPLLAELREELLVPPSERLVEEHLGVMMLEQQLLRPSARGRARPTRVRRRHPALVLLCACATFATFGLNAAGALPEPLQLFTNSITRPFRIPGPPHTQHLPSHDPSSISGSGMRVHLRAHSTVDRVAAADAFAAPAAAVPSPSPAGAPIPPPPAPRLSTAPTRHRRPTEASGGAPAPGTGVGAGTGTGRTPPPKSTSSKGAGSSKGPDPAVLPADWQQLAIDAATAQLETCAQAVTLDPSGCPQRADAIDLGVTEPGAPSPAVQWTFLNQPLAGAVAVVQTQPGAAWDDGIASQVTVYGAFQMVASYSSTGAGTLPRGAYSGGVAQAAMTWDGTSFENVAFQSGSVAGHLPTGVSVPPFAPPAGVTDSSVLAAVQAGFADLGGLVGDPTHGALVSFDPAQGNYSVSGTYTVTSDGSHGADDASSPGVVTKQYSATLCFDGDHLRLVGIAGS